MTGFNIAIIAMLILFFFIICLHDDRSLENKRRIERLEKEVSELKKHIKK